MVCVCFITGAPEGSGEWLWRRRDRTCDPGLQVIALIHYYTAASESRVKICASEMNISPPVA